MMILLSKNCVSMLKKINPDTFTEENLHKLEERMALYGSMILTERATMDQQNVLVRMFEERFGVPREGNLINFAIIDMLNGILVSQEGRDMKKFMRRALYQIDISDYL